MRGSFQSRGKRISRQENQLTNLSKDKFMKPLHCYFYRSPPDANDRSPTCSTQTKILHKARDIHKAADLVSEVKPGLEQGPLGRQAAEENN